MSSGKSVQAPLPGKTTIEKKAAIECGYVHASLRYLRVIPREKQVKKDDYCRFKIQRAQKYADP